MLLPIPTVTEKEGLYNTGPRLRRKSNYIPPAMTINGVDVKMVACIVATCVVTPAVKVSCPFDEIKRS